MSQVSISEHEKKMIISIVCRHFPTARIIAFGSRVRGDAKKYSDLDICIDTGCKLELAKFSSLEEELENSELIYKVDVCDWHRISPEFQKHVLETGAQWA